MRRLYETKRVEIRTQRLVLSHIFIKGVVTGRTGRYLVRGESEEEGRKEVVTTVGEPASEFLQVCCVRKQGLI